MTQEEYYKRMNALRDEEGELLRKKVSLKKEYIYSLPYKAGDKVTVKNFGECWIKKIDVADYGKITLDVFPKKKNGERSKAYRSLWYMDVNDIIVNGQDL